MCCFMTSAHEDVCCVLCVYTASAQEDVEEEEYGNKSCITHLAHYSFSSVNTAADFSLLCDNCTR